MDIGQRKDRVRAVVGLEDVHKGQMMESREEMTKSAGWVWG